MAGYWPSSFFTCLWTETDKTRPISSHPDRTSLVNNGLIMWENPERARERHRILPARVAIHSAGFDSSCPFTELAVQ